MALIDKSTNKYIEYHEVSIADWKLYQYLTKEEFGDTSAIYLATIPDTSLFRKYYNYRYIYFDSHNKQYQDVRGSKFNCNHIEKYPMIGISYEQAIEYCKWQTRTNLFSQNSKTHKIEFFLPTNADIELAKQFAEESYRPPLSEFKKSKKVCGLDDNVVEYTVENKREGFDGAVGFRCVGIVSEK